MAKKKITTTNAIPSLSNGVEQLELSHIVGGNMRWESHFGNSLEVSYKIKYKISILCVNVEK